MAEHSLSDSPPDNFPDTSSHVQSFSQKFFEIKAYPDTNVVYVDPSNRNITLHIDDVSDFVSPKLKIILDDQLNELERKYPPPCLFTLDDDAENLDEEMELWQETGDYNNHGIDGIFDSIKLENMCTEDSNPNDFLTFINIYEFPELFNSLRTVKWYQVYVWKWNEYVLTIYDSEFYIISTEKKNIIHVLYAPETDLQIGDCDTRVYLFNDKDLLIWNGGDVSSVVVIKQVN